MTFPRLSRALGGVLAIGLVAVPAVVTAGGATPLAVQLDAAATTQPSTSTVTYPLTRTRAVAERVYGRPGVVIRTPCRSVVRAATPGTAYVSSSRTGGAHLVHILTSPNRTSTWYGYMRSATIRSGQWVQAGQQIGTVGRQGIATSCSLYFAVTRGPSATRVSPISWLRYFVGKPVPNTWFAQGNSSFKLASFNTLGASHTVNNTNYASYTVRTPSQVSMLNAFGVDVAGLQEFQQPQRAVFVADTNNAYGIWPTGTTGDSDNSIIWRNSKFEFVSATTMPIPYFNGGIRQMPVVQLRQRATGLTAYFMNVHNPASIQPYGDQSAWRAKAIVIERAEVTALLKTGRPVFFTGDFNDRANAYCPVTAGGLMIAGNTVVPSTATSCTVPVNPWIDWIFMAGPAQFQSYTTDTTPKTEHISDHPIVLSQVLITR
ncbi:MAG: Endonuclease/exonuclease/phosphatase [Marmoricola sp.]|nr:Endonuclease/exonuclease/phosphatase [Marmoricola sp.]